MFDAEEIEYNLTRFSGDGGVAGIELSKWHESLSKPNLRALFRIDTLEGEVLTIDMSTDGYSIIGDEDSIDDQGPRQYFDTLEALLLNCCPSFKSHFDSSLFSKLSALSVERNDDESGSESGDRCDSGGD